MAATPPRRQPAAGPSTPHVPSEGREDLWADILRSADRAKALPRKNVVLLSERHRGRAHLLDKVVGKRRARQPLAIGYDLLTSDDRDDDTPPVSVIYPPSSHPSLLRLVDTSLPPHPLPNTAVVIVLDWSKPSTMVRELLAWLGWVDAWAARTALVDMSVAVDEMHERLQSHLQHYTEPTTAALTNYGAVLPLGQGSLTRNPSGVPIVVVCTRADLMDALGDEIGMKGGGWEERTDWIQQVLRTVCLAYGAALFYTAPTQPQTYTLLREYLFHRLYSSSQVEGAPQRFPFPHRANVLDRDAVMVPSGWDSWGKITILREPFDPARVGKAWDVSSSRNNSNGEEEVDAEGIEDLWAAMIPDMERPAVPNPAAVAVTSEPEQGFLQRQLDSLVKSDAKGVFRRAAENVDERYGVVGPMGTGGLSLPGVEKAMAEMEGNAAEDVATRLHARKDSKASGPSSPDRSSTVQNEALHNFFQGLLAKKQGTASANATPTKAAPKAAK
ncbi:hypothetical protein CspHIS471_0307840 [Cutaneotrichosporon sp. HIS471]|nr:hypothetical protein CspHIS471_0307840 [Cutaneotrichosporon sp. HIS471]